MRQVATKIVKKLTEAGHLAYFAGGWVRDFLLNHPSDDIDIATSASVAEVQALFPKTIPVGVAFGIVIVVEEGHQFEVATFRKDLGYVDGRRPTGIDSATAEEDAQRRDFTINGMFYDPLEEKILDFVSGQEDLKRGIIRAIGNPHDRFLEDRLRMMRAVRYSTRFGFPIEEKTKAAILAHATSLLPAVAMERIWQEFKKMSQFAHFDEGLVTLHELRLLPTIFPKLQKLSGELSCEEIRKRVEPIASFPPEAPPIAELLELFPDYSREDVTALCEYLKLSKADREFAYFLCHAKALITMPEGWQAKLETFEWAHFYANPHSTLSLHILAARFPPGKREAFLQEHAHHRQKLASAISRIENNTPLVSAHHLTLEGITPGKKMGALLKEAEKLAINYNLETPSAVLALLKKSPLWQV